METMPCICNILSIVSNFRRRNGIRSMSAAATVLHAVMYSTLIWNWTTFGAVDDLCTVRYFMLCIGSM